MHLISTIKENRQNKLASSTASYVWTSATLTGRSLRVRTKHEARVVLRRLKEEKKKTEPQVRKRHGICPQQYNGLTVLENINKKIFFLLKYTSCSSQL